MPRLPIVQSEESAQTGSAGAQMLRSDPADFGAIGAQEIGQVAQGLDTAARAGGRVLRASMYAEKRAKELQDNTWVANQFFNTTKNLNEWQADPQNNTSEDFAKNYLKTAQDQLPGILKQAPSPEAAQMFQDHFNTYLDHTYDRALDTGYATKFKNSITSVDSQISDLMDSYRNRQKTPGSNPDGEFLAGMNLLRATVNSNFHTIAPETERKLQQTITEQTANGVMNDNPDLARHIVSGHAGLDEEVRNHLNRQIDESQQVQLSLVKDSFTRSVEDNLTNLSNGKAGTNPIPEKQFQTMLPKEEAGPMYQRYTDHVDTINKVNTWKDTNDGLAPQYQKQAIEELHSKINGAHDEDTFQAIYKHYVDNAELMDKDRVAWMQQTNPKVRSLQQTASESSDSSRASAVTEYYNSILKYQGAAPKGTDPTEAKRYLDLPFNDRHLLTQADAQRYADGINKSSPQEVVQSMKKLMQNYPNPAHQQAVFNDLMTMPQNKLKQEYALLWQNRDHPDANVMAGVIQGGDSTKKLLDPKMVEQMDKSILTNPTWLKFQHTMIGGNFDRVKEIDGYRQGIANYAQAMVVKGMKPDAAVNKAVTDSMSTLGFATINGQSLAVLKDRGVPGKPPRTDGEIQDIGRKLSVALGKIDPREIDQSIFNKALAPYGTDETRIPRLQALRDQLTQRGMWVNTSDGQGAILNYRDDSGFPVELRDKQNRPFVIHFDDLPAMTVASPLAALHGGLMGEAGPSEIPEQPESTYPLTHSWKSHWSAPNSLWDMDVFGVTDPTYTATNFPLTPSWIGHEEPTESAPLMPNTISNPRADAALRAQVLDMKQPVK